jgi:glycosyltransferase involved in cell wall biosynthesis
MTTTKHILWVNDHAAPTGGCEGYVLETSRLLAERGVRSTLLYDPLAPTDASFLDAFDGAFPMVRPKEQVEDLQPDLIYTHRLASREHLRDLSESNIPTVRFLHDHRLFCLREHKYTAIGHKTCSRTIGLGCYSCSGGIRRKENGSLGFARLGALKAEQRENQALDAVVVASDYMASHAVDHGFDESRVHMIPLYSDPPPGTGTDPVGRQRDGFILFVGQLIRGKGLDILLRAMVDGGIRAPLVVVGTGRQEEDYRLQAQKWGLEDRVTFTGWLPSDRVNDLYRRASCVVVPSRAPETFGLVGPQAMSHGTPVIAAGVGGMGQWLDDGVTGLSFPSGDSKALASAIRLVVDDEDFAAALGAAGRERWERELRPERHVESLLRLFGALTQSVQ